MIRSGKTSLLRARLSPTAGLLALALSSVTSTLSAQHSEGFPLALSQETESFRVEISAPGPYTSGAAGTVKGAFHINDKYPYRFKTAAPAEGVSYPKPVLQRSDGQFQEKQAVFSVPFVASRPGTFDVGGILHLSVCGPGSCLVEKSALSVAVVVREH
jgi:hypothetical protein